MNDDLNAHLDEERAGADLPAALRDEAEAWNRLMEGLRRDVPGPAPDHLEERIMAEIRGLDASSGGRRGSWLFRPRTVRASPFTAALAAAAVLVLAVGPWIARSGGVGNGGAAGGPGGSEPVVYVQFVLEAPGAATVAVSGDFNEWDRTVHRLEDADGDGVWTGRVPVRPGIHEYMFVIDGERWITDPRADRYADDGFGNRNAVLAVAAPGRT